MINKTAIVTGSGRGIGRETAILLCKNGMNVVICSRTRVEIDSTVEEIKHIAKTGVDDRVIGIRCDVSNSFEVEHLVSSAIDTFKSIDILVNNAGIVYIKKLIDTSEDEWDKTIDINLEVANHNIRVMAICPGEVDTKMQQSVDLNYYKKNKNNMLQPITVAEKITEMIFKERQYHNGQSVEIG